MVIKSYSSIPNYLLLGLTTFDNIYSHNGHKLKLRFIVWRCLILKLSSYHFCSFSASVFSVPHPHADMSSLEKYQTELIEHGMTVGALKFGSFTLKSGRSVCFPISAGS